MNDQKKSTASLTPYLGYYGLLQISHLVFLVRAGIIYGTGGEIPFPAPPPPGGWTSEVIPFLLAMGALDGIAAFLGIYTAYFSVFRDKLLSKPLLVSLVMALTSAGVFAVGTIASGAWAAHPLAYGLLIVFFSPLFPLAYRLLFGADEPPAV